MFSWTFLHRLKVLTGILWTAGKKIMSNVLLVLRSKYTVCNKKHLNWDGGSNCIRNRLIHVTWVFVHWAVLDTRILEVMLCNCVPRLFVSWNLGKEIEPPRLHIYIFGFSLGVIFALPFLLTLFFFIVCELWSHQNALPLSIFSFYCYPNANFCTKFKDISIIWTLKTKIKVWLIKRGVQKSLFFSFNGICTTIKLRSGIKETCRWMTHETLCSLKFGVICLIGWDKGFG